MKGVSFAILENESGNRFQSEPGKRSLLVLFDKKYREEGREFDKKMGVRFLQEFIPANTGTGMTGTTEQILRKLRMTKGGFKTMGIEKRMGTTEQDVSVSPSPRESPKDSLDMTEVLDCFVLREGQKKDSCISSFAVALLRRMGHRNDRVFRVFYSQYNLAKPKTDNISLTHPDSTPASHEIG